MKIIVVGATGTIGRTVVERLGTKHEIVQASKNRGDVKVDITDLESIDAMFARVGAYDALISTTGAVHFGPLAEFTEAQFYLGIQSKMMGQINLVLRGQKTIRSQGCFVLTSGILTHDPVRSSASASAVNGALEGFTRAAALELIDRGIRINAVSPGLVEKSADTYGPFFPGHTPVAMDRVGLGYVKALSSGCTGQVIEVF